MKSKAIILALMLAAILSLGAADSNYQDFSCTNGGSGACIGDYSCGAPISGPATQVVRCLTTNDPNFNPNCRDCKFKCAQACGEASTCVDTTTLGGGGGVKCVDCCKAQVCSKYPASASYSEIKCTVSSGEPDQISCSCMNACKGVCDANTVFCNIIALLRIVTGIIAAIMLAIHGFRWIISEDPAARKDAKSAIWYVIIGALIIIVASALVGYFMGHPLECGALAI